MGPWMKSVIEKLKINLIMKKFNLLGSYPNPKNKRYVSENLRTIKHRITASYRGKEFYDGKEFLVMEVLNMMVDGKLLLTEFAKDII